MNPAISSPVTRKLHGQYYTKAAIGALLVDSLRQDVISTAIELGAGQGALIEAAQRRWPQLRFVSVDIDPGNVPACDGHLRKHYVVDALRKDLPQRIGLEACSADLALCNPPFALPQWERRYNVLLARAGLPVAGAATFGADALFIAQNLWLLRERGEMGVIVPAGLISGTKATTIREALLAQHDVHQVVELPVGAFSSTEVRTYLLCLQKGSGTHGPIILRKLGPHGDECPLLHIHPQDAARRMDYSFYQGPASVGRRHRPERAFEVFRGSIENAVARQHGWKVLHTCDLQGPEIRWDQSTRVPAPAHATRARKGDVLMARVGRAFHAKLGILQSRSAWISDCVFAIRSDQFTPDQLLRAFSSPAGQEWLASRARGACARYITKEDLQMFPIRAMLA